MVYQETCKGKVNVQTTGKLSCVLVVYTCDALVLRRRRVDNRAIIDLPSFVYITFCASA